MTTETPARALSHPPSVGGASFCDRLVCLAEDLDGAGFRVIAEHLINLAYRLLDTFADLAEAPDAGSAMGGSGSRPAATAAPGRTE